jgi:lipopolysaccharide/colanic/teichoic acid biosynthesis glycosyltransferase
MQYFEDWHKRRFLVLPGLTGLWQVTGRQIDGLSLHDAMILDVFYAENFTIWLDIKIILKTIPVVLFGKSKI